MSRLFVEVRMGPGRGTRKAIAPGSSLRIGRTERADLVVPGDSHISAVHCELTWSQGVCTLRDLNSIEGTFVDGVPVQEARLRDGDSITLGATQLTVHFEDGLPPRKKDAPSPEVRKKRLSALSALRSLEAPLYTVLDAARDPRVLGLLMRSEEERASLYEGAQGQALDHVAPYLVRLEKGSKLLERLVLEGWGNAWGIYLTWTGKKRDLRSHLRRFLIVLDEETGKKLYFRFYDPRVLRAFLPTCSTAQIADVLGEIGTVVLEGEDASVLRFTKAGAPW